MTKAQLLSSPRDQEILIATFKSSLGTDPILTSLMNVTIASIADTEGRRLQQQTKKETLRTRLLARISLTFRIRFNVDQQGFLNVDDGMTQVTTKFAADASTGVFTDTLHANAEGGDLSTAVGDADMTYSATEVTTVALFNPTMQPTVSPKPSVLPTIMPSTQKPTLQPTTAVPSFAPTFRTGGLISLYFVW